MRQLVEYVNSGIQPMQCPACVNRARETPESASEWSRFFNERGPARLRADALEVIAGETGGGRFCVGDEFSAADILLVTQVWSARRFNSDLSAMPRVRAVFDEAMRMPHAERARPENQPDAPKT